MILLLLAALLLVVFTLQNAVNIDVKFLFWQLSQVPLVLTLLGCVLLGFLSAMAINYPAMRRLKSNLKNLQKEVDRLQTGRREKHPEGERMTGGTDNDFFDA